MTNIHQLDKIPIRNGKLGSSQVLSGTNLMMIWANVRAGGYTPAHKHPNEQMTWLTAGRMEYRIGDAPPTMCGPGTVVHIPPNVEHEVWYHEDCRFCEIFTPPRFDLYPAAAKHPYAMDE